MPGPTSWNKTYTDYNKLLNFVENYMLNINTMMLGQVVSFDPATQLAVVQPSIMMILPSPNGTETIFDRLQNKVTIQHLPMAPIQDVPVQYMRSGDFAITMPIAVGTTGMLIFCQRDISLWMKNGGVAQQGQLNRFDINDAVFIPGVFNNVNKLADYNPNALEIRAGSDKISMDGSNIVITSGGNVNVTGDQVNVTGSTVNVDGDTVNLAGGGAGVARIGDDVNLTTGKIITGSTKVFSG